MAKANVKNLSPTAKAALGNVIYPLISLGLVLAVWAIAATVKNNAILLPMPDVVFLRFFQLFGEAKLWNSVGWTLLRTLISFAVSFVLAFVLATLGGIWKPLHRVVSPIVGILRAVPTMAVILIIMLWVDFQNAPKYIGFLIAFPILYPAIYTAIDGVDDKLVEMTTVFKVRPLDKITHLYLPSIAPSVFDVSRSTISLTLKVVIAAEVLCQTKTSIGLSLQYANLTFDVSELLAWTVFAIALSFVLEGVVVGLKKLWEVRR